jgi:23S rRNA pseudouridine955/2504/2580 synthase
MAHSFFDEVFPLHEPMRLDRWLKRGYNGLTQSAIEKAVRKKLVKVNGKKGKAGYSLNKGDCVSIENLLHQKWAQAPAPERAVPLCSLSLDSMILAETDSLLILNKPAGLNVQNGLYVKESLDTLLKAHSAEYRLVHRLDRPTSGVLVVAKTLDMAIYLTRLFRERNVTKIYRAWVWGRPSPPEGVIDARLSCPDTQNKKSSPRVFVDNTHGQPARTLYKIVQEKDLFSEVEIRPHTGRKHQIRVHFAHIGHPIVGENVYTQSLKELRGGYTEHKCRAVLSVPPKPSTGSTHPQIFNDGGYAPRKPGYLLPPHVLLLHSWHLAWVSPHGADLSWTAPLPPYWMT